MRSVWHGRCGEARPSARMDAVRRDLATGSGSEGTAPEAQRGPRPNSSRPTRGGLSTWTDAPSLGHLAAELSPGVKLVPGRAAGMSPPVLTDPGGGPHGAVDG